jgi:hypothetical protein
MSWWLYCRSSITDSYNLKPADIITDKTICSGASFLWMVRATTNQTGTKISVSWWLYCRSSIELEPHLKPADIITDKTICSDCFPLNEWVIQRIKGTRFPERHGTADQVLNWQLQRNQQISLQTKQFVPVFLWNGTSYTTNQTGTRFSGAGICTRSYWTWQLQPKPADNTWINNLFWCFLWNGTSCYNERVQDSRSWWLYCRSSIELDSYTWNQQISLQTKQFVLVLLSLEWQWVIQRIKRVQDL